MESIWWNYEKNVKEFHEDIINILSRSLTMLGWPNVRLKYDEKQSMKKILIFYTINI